MAAMETKAALAAEALAVGRRNREAADGGRNRGSSCGGRSRGSGCSGELW